MSKFLVVQIWLLGRKVTAFLTYVKIFEVFFYGLAPLPGGLLSTTLITSDGSQKPGFTLQHDTM